MADANDPSNTTPANADDQAAKDAAAKAAVEKEAAEKAEAEKKAAADKKAAEKKAAQDKKLANTANAPQAPATPAESAAPADKPARTVNDPTLNNRGGRGSDLKVLIDAMPDELYDAFVVPYNLNDRGVDEEKGFDLRKISNPALDGLRLRLREQGYNV